MGELVSALLSPILSDTPQPQTFPLQPPVHLQLVLLHPQLLQSLLVGLLPLSLLGDLWGEQQALSTRVVVGIMAVGRTGWDLQGARSQGTEAPSCGQ